MRKALALIAAMAAAPALAQDMSPWLPGAGLRGEAEFRLLGARIYGAQLFTKGGAAYAPGGPAALRLTYFRQISAGQFLRTTMSELARIEGARADHPAIRSKLAPCFRDVTSGDNYVAYSGGANDLRLALNGRNLCRINHPNIAPRFLDIWLSPQSRSARLSRQLRGG